MGKVKKVRKREKESEKIKTLQIFF